LVVEPKKATVPEIMRTSVVLTATQTDAASPPTAWVRAGVDNPKEFACGEFHFIACDAGGLVFTWGQGLMGVLGHGSEDDETQPRQVEALAHEPVVSVAAGPYHSVALTSDGRLFVWGWMPTESGGAADAGDLSVEETFSCVPRPLALEGGVKVAGIACGCFATAVWDASGQLYTWGRGSCGELGHGTTRPVATPQPVDALTGVRVARVAFGGAYSKEGSTGFMLVHSQVKPRPR
jgi:alpha-tubulin suppressor-like RCC1 family protein